MISLPYTPNHPFDGDEGGRNCRGCMTFEDSLYKNDKRAHDEYPGGVLKPWATKPATYILERPN